jgi:hypothetical protein
VTTGLNTRGGCLRIVVVVALLMAPAMDRGPVGNYELLLPPSCKLQKCTNTRLGSRRGRRLLYERQFCLRFDPSAQCLVDG